MEGGQKSFELPEGGGTKKFSLVKVGGSKKFGQIESIMKIKMHNLLPKLTGYKPQIGSIFQNFPGPFSRPGTAPYT